MDLFVAGLPTSSDSWIRMGPMQSHHVKSSCAMKSMIPVAPTAQGSADLMSTTEDEEGDNEGAR